MSNALPPPALDYARVLAYAVVDDTVEWTGRQRLYVNDELLGRVPHLAIGQNLSVTRDEFLLFHCNEKWEVLGVVPRDSVSEIRDTAERWYRGIEEKWIETDSTPESAERWIRAQERTVSCSFCEKFPTQVESMTFGKSACICDECIKRLHERQRDSGSSGAA
jgi:ClpX C4-type zinc finger